MSVIRPSEVSPEVGWFDRFAEWTSSFTARAPFFAGCVLFVILWLVQGIAFSMVQGWGYFPSTAYQLEVNSTTTVITFLLIALLQNSQARANNAIQHKLNAIADALADQMAADGREDHARELRAAVGLERRESA